PSVSWNGADGGREVLTLKRAGEVETIEMSAKDRRWDVVRAELHDAAGKIAWRITHEDFADVGGERFPEKTVIEQPLQKADARIRFKSRDLNPALPDSVFHLEPPAGVPVETVRCD